MYVHQLAKKMIEHGHECIVLSLSNELQTAEYDNIKIRYIPFEVNAFNDVEHPRNIDALIQIINDYSPDVFHLHTYTSSMGLKHLLKVKELGVKVYFTSHLPDFTCLRGDLMQYGTEVCDGLVSHQKCMNCYLHSTGIVNEFSRNILLKASNIGFLRNKIPRLNKYKAKIDILNAFKKNIEAIIVVSEWQKEILKLNGFAEKSISVCRQAIDMEQISHDEKKYDNLKIKIGFIGRIVKIKGLHILLDILNKFDPSKFELSIIAIKSVNEIEYYNSMRFNASKLGSNWLENLNNTEVFNFLDNIDLLVVPSIWLETGPYVAFEALARKVPILSFNYGGIKEIVNDDNGFLVNNEDEMEYTFGRIFTDKYILNSKSNNINRVRSSEELYSETIKIYSSN